MNKRLAVTALAGCAVAAATEKSSKPLKPEVWDKMAAKMEGMTADFPQKD